MPLKIWASSKQLVPFYTFLSPKVDTAGPVSIELRNTERTTSSADQRQA